MGPGVDDGGVPPLTIEFPNGNKARAVVAAPRRRARELLTALGLASPRPVLLIIGGAESLEPAAVSALERLIERGAIRAAGRVGAAVIDGGTESGVMAVVGEAAAASDASIDLLGVAPAGRVTFPGDNREIHGATLLDPNHSHFLLANSDEWGGETSILFDALQVLARDRPAAVILAGGGPVALDEMRTAVQLGLPAIVITGTGGVADELAARATSGPHQPSEDALSRVAAEGDLTLIPVAADASQLEMATSRLLTVDETLAEAWHQQRLLSMAAARQQREFRRMQAAILLLGVLVTFLVVTKAVLDRAGALAPYPPLEGAFYLVILALPITVASLAAMASRTRPGGRWVLLRGTSEALKREIYLYRTRAGVYGRSRTREVSRQVKLAQAIGTTMGSLMRTDVNMVALGEAARATPDAGSPALDAPVMPLTPTAYVKQRIDPQVAWYRRKAADHERTARWLRWLAIGFGGFGTLLAALGLDIWVAVTTALVGAYTTILEAWQLETTVVLYNQASTDLTAIRTWWFALPPGEQELQQNVDRLVERSERIIRAEHVGWVQEMQDAMTQLRLEETAEGTARGSGGTSIVGNASDDAAVSETAGAVLPGEAARGAGSGIDPRR